MAFNQVPIGPQRLSSVDDFTTSASDNSSTVSESPREMSIALSSITSPNARYSQSMGLDEFSSTPKFEDTENVRTVVVKTEPVQASSCVLAVDTVEASSSVPPVGAVTSEKRKRGRPRKLPKPEGTPSRKVIHPRSKTGCMTCRDRKKKCDEVKPECGPCKRGHFHCFGYRPKQIWKSGRQKAILQNLTEFEKSGAKPLPPFLPGMDVGNDIDWKYYQYYNEMLSKRLNLNSDENNPFLVHLLPMAQSHTALMHAILACSGSHLLQNNRAAAASADMVDRQGYHWSEAVNAMCQDQDLKENKPRLETLAQSVVHQLQTIVEGNHAGHWRLHVKAVRDMLNYQPKPDEMGAYSFFAEFFRYHDMSTFLTTSNPETIPDDELPKFFQFSRGRQANFMAVCEGLEIPTRQIHALRNRVRQRRKEGKEPFVDYKIMEEGRVLSLGLEQTPCSHSVSTPEWICWQLYRVCVFLYLQRTIMTLTPKGPGPSIKTAVQHGIEYLQSTEPNSPIQSLLLLPIFLVGTCAWWPEGRTTIMESLRVCEDFSRNGNIKHARNILLQLWKMMDENDPRVWDYEEVMTKDMGMDMLVT